MHANGACLVSVVWKNAVFGGYGESGENALNGVLCRASRDRLKTALPGAANGVP